MRATGYLFGLPAVLAGVLAASQAVLAGDVEPSYRISVRRSGVEVTDESGVMIVPKVIVRERCPSTQPQVEVRTIEPRVTVEPAPQITIEPAPRVTVAPQRRVVVPPAANIYAYREVQPRHETRWYGDRYMDDWMFTLKPYTLADDYRLYNKAPGAAEAMPQPQPDVYGYIGEEEIPEPNIDRTARQVTGIIRELRLAEPEQAGPPGVIIVVQTDEGVARRVQTSRDEVRRLGLVLGQRIIAAGEPRIRDGESVLVASRIEGVAARSPAGPPVATTGNWYHGVILSTQVLQPLGLPDRHLVATVALDGGQTMPVDLGPVANIPAGQIQPNERVTIMARLRSVEGRPVLMADLLQLPNATMQINREGEPMAP